MDNSNDDVQRRIWEKYDEVRQSGTVMPNPASIIKSLQEDGIHLNIDHAAYFSRVLRGPVASSIPKYIPQFIAAYLKDKKASSIMGPFAVFGSLIVPIINATNPEVALAFCRNQEVYEAAQLLNQDVVIDWQLGDVFSLLDDIKTSFDAIVSCPPLGWRLHPDDQVGKIQGINLKDDLGNILLLKSCIHLKEDGIGFFVVMPSFFFKRTSKSVLANLNKFGLYINAALSLPPGTFETTNIPTLLVVIQREKADKLFVGELTSESGSVLLRNLKQRKEGKVPHLGALVDEESFTSFSRFIAEWEIGQLSQRIGYPPVPLSEVVLEINMAKRKQEEEFEQKPNSVYLPLIGRSPAVASLDDLQIKPQNYVQLVLDPNKADAEYVAGFLNTTLGMKLRESLCSGFIPKISKTRLEQQDSNLYLPEKETQAGIVRIQSSIKDLTTRLESMKRQLWNQPRKAKEIEKALKTLNQEESLEEWIETLPYPLASILWAYSADSSIEHKALHLINFFDALSEFNATLILSAFASNDSFYRKHSVDWIEKDEEHKDWISTAAFGNWNMLGFRLAKKTRKLMGENSELCMTLFGAPENDFLSMVSDKALYSVLEEVRGVRNRWKGHGGVPSEKENREVLAVLESLLSKARNIITDNYTTAKLLIPGTNEYSQGIYEYEASLLQGTRTPFRKTQVSTLVPMDKRRIYLLHENQLHPIQMLPFFRIMESPTTQQNACYFYNRLEDDKVRWVSYHFEDEVEIIRPDVEVAAAISLLRPKQNGEENSNE